MKKKPAPINSLQQAVEYFKATLDNHPERKAWAAMDAALSGVRRPHAVLYLGYLARPDDQDAPEDEWDLPEIRMPDSPESFLARELIQILDPLRMLNPVTPCLGLGKGTGTLVPAFGIPLDPTVGNTPAHVITLEQALARPPPDPENSGLMPEMLDRIRFIQSHLPSGVGIHIGMPDMQGPYNIVHAIIGEDALIGPYAQPELFHQFMARLTDYWIAARKTLVHWIGPEWLFPLDKRTVHIAECSVNLISRKMYEEFVLPYDLRIARAFGLPLDIHTCSGPHVFHATLERLPNVVLTEAGFIKCAVAGSTPVDEALAAIGDRPIVLRMGQELFEGQDFAGIIQRDFDRYAKNQRLIFGYTGMDWRTRHRPFIRELHRRLDDYWAKKFG